MLKGKACLVLLLIMMEPVEETCIPLVSFNSNFLHLIFICHILCRQIGRLNCSCVSLAVFYSCTLCHFSVYLKLTALNSVDFLNTHPSQTPTLFYTYIILHFKFLSFGALKVGFSKSVSSPVWGKYRGNALPLSDKTPPVSCLIRTFKSTSCFLFFTEEVHRGTMYISVSFLTLIILLHSNTNLPRIYLSQMISKRGGRGNNVPKEQIFI